MESENPPEAEILFKELDELMATEDGWTLVKTTDD